jgi:hypothetical protein
MSPHELIPHHAVATDKPAATRSIWVSLVWRVVSWAKHCADQYAAAAMYQQLSGLSDTELTHRGLSRANLAHDVSDVFATGDHSRER